MNSYKIYILKSERTNKYYIGCTSDLMRRIQRHNSFKVASTKSGIPWKIVYTEEYSTLSLARSRENKIKNWKKRVAIEKLIESGAFV